MVGLRSLPPDKPPRTLGAPLRTSGSPILLAEGGHRDLGWVHAAPALRRGGTSRLALLLLARRVEGDIASEVAHTLPEKMEPITRSGETPRVSGRPRPKDGGTGASRPVEPSGRGELLPSSRDPEGLMQGCRCG